MDGPERSSAQPAGGTAAVNLGFGAAFLAGLVGSSHCAAMCGGIAAAFSARPASPYGVVGRTVRFNIGRLAGYALVGTLVHGVLAAGGSLLPFTQASLVLRLLAALFMAALALRLLTGRDPLGLAPAGLAFWRWLAPLSGRALRLPESVRPVALGLLWGFMPCGLVYSVLLIAAAAPDLASAAITMAGFWAGTVPTLVTLGTGSAVGLAGLTRSRYFAQGAGVIVLAGAVLTAYGAIAAASDPGHHGHGAACISSHRAELGR